MLYDAIRIIYQGHVHVCRLPHYWRMPWQVPASTGKASVLGAEGVWSSREFGGVLTKEANCCKSISGWWFGTSILFSHILGMSSSQLTFIFFRGVQTTNQI